MLTSDINLLWSIDRLSMKMVDRHMAHEEDEPEPWHEIVLDISGNNVCASGADEERSYSCPEIEKPDEVK